MQTQMPKRFIAGAICPKCQAQDTIWVCQTDTYRYRACADCSFSEELPAEEKPIKQPKNDFIFKQKTN